MKKTFLSILLLVIIILNTSCAAKDNKLMANGYADAKEFEVCNVSNKSSSLGKYAIENGLLHNPDHVNENASDTKSFKIGKKTYELSYQKSFYTVSLCRDVYNSDDGVAFDFYMDTDMICGITSADNILDKYFPIEGYDLETESGFLAYSENVAKLLDYDLSGLTYSCSATTEPDGEKQLLHSGYYIPKDGETVTSRYFSAKKQYDNELSLTAFELFFVYEEGNIELRSISIRPYAEKIFYVNDAEIEERIKNRDWGEFKHVEVGKPILTTILNNKVCYRVELKYGYDSVSAATSLYIIPKDVDFFE